jgi:FkbM family methyltransferase
MLIVTILLIELIETIRADNELGVIRSFKGSYPDWKPRGIVDVGANRGGWTTNVQKLFPNVTTFMVEASPFHEKALEDAKSKFDGVVDYKIALLSKTDGESVKFYDNPATNTGNSMFQENSQHFVNVEPTSRTTSKLDTLVSSMEHVDILKLDVQGAELMVLSGAAETLKRATLVQFEASIIEYNKGGACWYEIDELLRSYGFHLYDMSDFSRNEVAFHTKAIGQLDVLYVRPGSDFIPQWLVDNKVQFCGSGRYDTKESQVNNNNNNEQKKITDAGLNSKSQEQHLKVIMMALVTFAVGYYAGQKKSKGVIKTK